jgi:outer membrane receptor protein involved in Fe transport
VVGVEGSNPNLKAVTSTNATFGFIFEPLKALNVSVDWYRIELKSYAATDHLSLHGSITNLFDSQPPVDLQTYGGGGELAYSTLDQDGAVGRFFLIGATYKF